MCIISRSVQIYLERVMRETLEGMEYIGAGINCNIVNNLRFADDKDLIARQLGDLQHLLSEIGGQHSLRS